MSDLPGGALPLEDELDLGLIDDEPPPEPELDADGNPVEPEPELDADGNPVEPEPEPPQTQQQRRKGEAQRYRERLERTERELAELRTAQQQPRQPPVVDQAALRQAEAEKWERRAMMSPVELAQDMSREFAAQQQQQQAQQQYQTNNAIDKLSYEADARNSVLHKRYQQRVEALVAQEHARGNLVSREQAIAWLHWQDTKAQGARAVPAQRRAANGRVQRQTVRPSTGRGDGARPGARDQNDLAAARARLAGKPLWE